MHRVYNWQLHFNYALTLSKVMTTLVLKISPLSLFHQRLWLMNDVTVFHFYFKTKILHSFAHLLFIFPLRHSSSSLVIKPVLHYTIRIQASPLAPWNQNVPLISTHSQSFQEFLTFALKWIKNVLKISTDCTAREASFSSLVHFGKVERWNGMI